MKLRKIAVKIFKILSTNEKEEQSTDWIEEQWQEQ